MNKEKRTFLEGWKICKHNYQIWLKLLKDKNPKIWKLRKNYYFYFYDL